MPKVPERYLEERRQSIVVAASRVFERKGVQAATMAEIATEAGITPGAIYRYFTSKDDLAVGCFRANAAVVAQLWSHPPAPGVSAVADFSRLATITFGLLNDPQAERDTVIHLEHMLDRFRDGPPLREHAEQHEQAISILETRLASAQAAGEISSEFDPRSLSHALIAFYWGARLERLANPAADSMQMLRQMLLLLGMASPNKKLPASTE